MTTRKALIVGATGLVGGFCLQPFKKQWPHYIRVHHPEFIAGTMKNGISLNELMDALRENAFGSTQENPSSGSRKH